MFEVVVFQKKVSKILKNSFGNVIEWYDFCLFGYFASVIGNSFFSTQSKFVSILLAFATFAIGFLARPIGGFIFGWLGDKIGRYYSMNLSIIMMGGATFLVSFLPSYHSIGIWAPILLVIIRIIQGLSAGGQFSSLIVVTSEDKNLKNTGFYTGIALSVSVLGFLLASAVSYIVMNILPQEWIHYTWRVCFAIGGLLLVFYFCSIHDEIKASSLIEKKESRETKENKNTFKELWLNHKFKFTVSVFLSGVVCIIFYLDFVYFISFFTRHSHISQDRTLILNTVVLAIACILYPVFGYVSDKIGRAKLAMYGIVIHILLLPFIFKLILSNNISSIYIGMLVMTVLICIIQSAATPIFSEIFPKKVRSSGCCASYGLGAAISGFAPMVATEVTHHNVHNIVYLFAITLVVGLLCVIPIVYDNRKQITVLEKR
ncbi:proline/betaine transporter [Vibrio angustum S14]|uniref:Proline/betaine transporter n=1 Tax=Photobacterium angustum (strain S14 / CCUG 15956) TaxID=314292 RepID=Q1ZN44_PHOAS|nr:proline/betaine transporter [Vibrio angustum S14] [Photobacterium angustum S14]